MSASAYSTHPARFAFGTGFDAYPVWGGGGPPVNFGSLLKSSVAGSLGTGQRPFPEPPVLAFLPAVCHGAAESQAQALAVRDHRYPDREGWLVDWSTMDRSQRRYTWYVVGSLFPATLGPMLLDIPRLVSL